MEDPRNPSHTYQCTKCDTQFSWVRYTENPDRVYLTCRRRIPRPQTPLSREWLKELSPESWGIGDDVFLKYIGWCPSQERCSTNFRWHRLLQQFLPITEEENSQEQSSVSRPQASQPEGPKVPEVCSLTSHVPFP